MWKIEGLDRREDCENVVAAARRGGRDKVGCIILGRGEDDKKVREWLTTAAAVPGFIGFAVGRTSFWDPLVDWRAERDHARGRGQPNRRAATASSLTSSRRRPVPHDGGTVKIAPSILAADFARLGAQVTEAERAGADRIHIDVMDGHFVPNLSMGAPIVASLRRVTQLPLETHLMISDPDSYLDEFVEAGSDSFLVHWEGKANLHRTVQRIRSLGKGVGVAINPATPPRCWKRYCKRLTRFWS